MKIDNSTEIVSVKITNIDTGEEKELFERQNSKCHFRDVIVLGKYFIQLRLDWTDIKNGEPVLDADIWTEKNGRKTFLEKKKQPSHHTIKRYDDSTVQYIYNFEFEGLTLRLITRKTVAKTVTIDAILTK